MNANGNVALEDRNVGQGAANVFFLFLSGFSLKQKLPLLELLSLVSAASDSD